MLPPPTVTQYHHIAATCGSWNASAVERRRGEGMLSDEIGEEEENGCVSGDHNHYRGCSKPPPPNLLPEIRERGDTVSTAATGGKRNTIKIITTVVVIEGGRRPSPPEEPAAPSALRSSSASFTHHVCVWDYFQMRETRKKTILYIIWY
jgi:hypothetical protein